MPLRLAGASSSDASSVSELSDVATDHSAVEEPKLLTKDEIEKIWNSSWLDARRIWAEIAKRPDGYPFKELQEAVQFTGLEVGGRLSSVGHAFKHYKAKGKAHPIIKDYYTKTYRMDGELAKWVRELAGKENL